MVCLINHSHICLKFRSFPLVLYDEKCCEESLHRLPPYDYPDLLLIIIYLFIFWVYFLRQIVMWNY